jgi:hypothetical protein
MSHTVKILISLAQSQQTNILFAYYEFWSPTREYIAFLDFTLDLSVIYIYINKQIRCCGVDTEEREAMSSIRL